MAAHLLAHGWQYVVVDIQWYEPAATGYDYRKGAALVLDAWGRLQPAENRFPSAAGGAGFAALAGYVHSQGLRFNHPRGDAAASRGQQPAGQGHGLPRARTAANMHLPLEHGQRRTAVQPWAQVAGPHDSVFALIASWGVDYVKVDDISRPYHEHQREIEGVRLAIDHSPAKADGASSTPGETALDAAEHVSRHANMWRISDDFWDSWKSLDEQFARLENWNPHRMTGAWPGADDAAAPESSEGSAAARPISRATSRRL